ncbi:adenylate cyclase [Methylobacterium sp. Leaf469]|jgi:adenylate cyclase|uniref:adenylate/guanylate cyclase domain-containing protein n=1 Tax=unclassified Methylobacterium TaxID=2615210 RepID=UPI00070202A1|nr:MULTISPECIES: adenylate/guanylate cyclase domain-containing protein [unclassified Methylobacterium]USU30205.1 adenylate/guanylate cyclase domain-containing protein [Methylobacterium sp. OTU13CASTA1]KQO73065.1 adenylate cyclase [Methylobacterium sp. Leaf87]KQP30428.1 adenylate cyclase [Methylobacterium sp. Leaf102]KQP32357.1 adenylate cyclase [Methylobacterium sp. Leaf100]KQP66143.1 adenylate cyclase [Methylobacterium sp. Leaf112]
MLPQHRWFWVLILVACGGAGLLYNVLFAGGATPLAGLAYGLCVGATTLAFDRGLILGGLQVRMRRLPAKFYVPAAELAYVLMIAAGIALGGLVVWSLGLTDDDLSHAIKITPRVLAYSLAVSALLVFVIRMRDLIGGEVFVNFLVGRYHRPVREERIFLFLDVVGSTAFAETHGDLTAQAYLGAVFAAMAEPVRRNSGSTDDYIGDMAMITWPMARGLKNARCVACVFDVMDRIESEAEAWRARFGTVPRLRAALHGGSVVTAEVGVDRHKIAYFGDAVNVTARIESLCRPLGTEILVSDDLLARLPYLPAGIAARSLGAHALRGRGQPMNVSTLERIVPVTRTEPVVLPRRTVAAR